MLCRAIPSQFIAAAGNDASKTETYPAAYKSPAVISVGAIDSSGALSVWDDGEDILGGSNYGKWVHLAAPGTNILSTYPSKAVRTLK